MQGWGPDARCTLWNRAKAKGTLSGNLPFTTGPASPAPAPCPRTYRRSLREDPPPCGGRGASRRPGFALRGPAGHRIVCLLGRPAAGGGIERAVPRVEPGAHRRAARGVEPGQGADPAEGGSPGVARDEAVGEAGAARVRVGRRAPTAGSGAAASFEIQRREERRGRPRSQRRVRPIAAAGRSRTAWRRGRLREGPRGGPTPRAPLCPHSSSPFFSVLNSEHSAGTGLARKRTRPPGPRADAGSVA